MSKIAHIARVTLIGLAISAPLALGGAAAAQDAAAAKPAKPARQCFYLSDWRGWSAPNKDTLYLKVRGKDVYKVDLAYGSNQLTWPGTHLGRRQRLRPSGPGPQRVRRLRHGHPDPGQDHHQADPGSDRGPAQEGPPLI